MVTLIVEREIYTAKDGKEYSAYFVKTRVYGKSVKIDLMPRDSGGYIVLEIMFEQATDVVTLTATPSTMKDEKTGREIAYTAYKATCTGADGETLETEIKPKRNSDKTLIAFLLREQAKLDKAGKQ